ncbi:hypothetical protein U9M48_039252 [Paspalum notatum var. saurae]|uniref:Protein FAR1-RELATED SEQUENCE n=1 Tax=Paspalum notatum var. saurae TaxID=547442 RepID=A0AAQ3UJS2_PASNO
MNHHKDQHVILTDEDPAMKIAIPRVFRRTLHRFCRWHITRPWEHELDELYREHRDRNLHEKIETLINWPLRPTKFEAA